MEITRCYTSKVCFNLLNAIGVYIHLAFTSHEHEWWINIPVFTFESIPSVQHRLEMLVNYDVEVQRMATNK